MASLTKRFALQKKTEADGLKHKCQKCLQYGHWTYECQNKRKYVQRESRTKLLKKKIKALAQEKQIAAKEITKQVEANADADDENVTESDDSSSSSSSSSSDSSSDSEEEPSNSKKMKKDS
ncbi:zinc finger CCHC domain-containing protein 10 [Hydra vulgaris]|uniref:Zinc finger CCHC domain-containing protein 10 n=1 Tax=Hydra vulgaris TaxID=6087 RepID=A0ABM4D325_HYDVU